MSYQLPRKKKTFKKTFTHTQKQTSKECKEVNAKAQTICGPVLGTSIFKKKEADVRTFFQIPAV